jgi:hypothetical protein
MKINFTWFRYPDHTIPKGRLPRDKAAQACWYFYVIAQAAKEKIGDSTEDQFGLLDDELWMDKRYVQQARSVAALYQLESPDQFMRYWPAVVQEARDCGLPEPAPEYMRPLRFVGLN